MLMMVYKQSTRLSLLRRHPHRLLVAPPPTYPDKH